MRRRPAKTFTLPFPLQESLAKASEESGLKKSKIVELALRMWFERRAYEATQRERNEELVRSTCFCSADCGSCSAGDHASCPACRKV